MPSYALVFDCRLSPSTRQHQADKRRTTPGRLLLLQTRRHHDLARVSTSLPRHFHTELHLHRLGHTINKFRINRLGLGYLSTASAITMIERCGIPWTYCLSPALVTKPIDWLCHIGGGFMRIHSFQHSFELNRCIG